jgi:hypothetical protein
VTTPPGVVPADADYWANGHIDALRQRGIIPIIAPEFRSWWAHEGRFRG